MHKFYSPAPEEDLEIKNKFSNTEEATKQYLRAKKRELLWLTATVRLRTKKET